MTPEPSTFEIRRQRLLDRLKDIRERKEGDWKRSVRQICYRLSRLEDPFSEHEDVGTEQRGRKVYRLANEIPDYDEFGDESEP